MKAHIVHGPTFRTAGRILLAVMSVVGSLSVGASSSRANGDPDLEWDVRGRGCFEAFGVGVVPITSFAPNFAVEGTWLSASGTYVVGGSADVTMTVPNAYFDMERSQLDGEPMWGAFLMGFEFVDNCDDQNPTSFSPCFSTSPEPDPWILDLGGEYMFWFFYGDVPAESGPRVSTISITPNTGSCDPDPEDDVPGGWDFDEAFDLIDEFDLKFPSDLRPDYDFDIDIDHYRRMAEPRENVLPHTR